MKEIYTTLVIEGGLAPDYVLDEMQIYELEPLISNIHKKNRESWELTRMIAFVIALVNSTKKLSPSDIMKFRWDEKETAKTSISNADVERLRKEAKLILKRKENG